MAFPSQSTALSASPGSLWWYAKYADDSGALIDHVCATQGNSFVEFLQQTLKATAPSGGPPGRNSPVLDPTGLTVDRQFGVQTLTALYNLLVNMSAPQSILDACLSDFQQISANPTGSLWADVYADASAARGNPISWGTMAGALWASYNNNISFSALGVPVDTVTVLFGIEPPADGSAHGPGICWKSGDPTPLEAGGGSATTPTSAPTGSIASSGLGPTGMQSSSFFTSVSRVFQGQSSGSSFLDVAIPVGAAALGVGAIALIVVATEDNKRRRGTRRKKRGRRR